jgi:DNA polymerase III epsilon subunit-like protein
MKFVALDLETTWLDPNTDTIIEVAAIWFCITKDAHGHLIATDIDERTMLINPGKKLTEEISMITGITESMLEGKPLWEEVQQRVTTFISDATIVGHNVLFDIGMLATHGIDLSQHTVLDTFELSEIFSQEAESLNLGFLGWLYGISAGEAEHRALGDTRVSISLLLRYLNTAPHLNTEKKSILRLLAKNEKTRNIAVFNELVGIEHGKIFTTKYETYTVQKEEVIEELSTKSMHLFSIDGDIWKEREYILSQVQKYNKIYCIVPNKKVQSFLTQELNASGCDTTMGIWYSRWCSLDEVQSMVESDTLWERKMTIFMWKILFWLETTTTWLLEELTLYWEEREYIRFFRLEADEYNHFRTSYQEKIKKSSCTVYDANEFFENPPQEFVPAIIIKDIPLFEDILRRSLSIHIPIESIIADLRAFPHSKNLIFWLYLIADLYEHIPSRPIGDHPFPPGNFWETYFFRQEQLWKEWGKWLILFSELLKQYYYEWRWQLALTNRRDRIRLWNIEKPLLSLIDFALYKQDNIGTIIHIQESGTTIHLIPRDISLQFEYRINLLNTDQLSGYGYGINGPILRRFLKSECGLHGSSEPLDKDYTKIAQLSLYNENEEVLPGSVILTTSQKHIREIGKNLKKWTSTIFMQGISGGKGKMASLFEKNITKSILIGLIDTWKDEFDIWKIAKSVYIAKLPFDPPSDPYFLARTVGMSDNFALYSEPMAIMRINTLIGRIRSAGYQWAIVCMDDRLEKTIWGKEIAEEIL